MIQASQKTGRKRQEAGRANQYGVFPVTVSGIRRLSDHFVRVSLTGPSLHRAAAPISDGTGRVFDAYIKLLVPPAGEPGPVLLDLDPSWRSRWLAQPAKERGYIRTYTVQNSRLVPQAPAGESQLPPMRAATGADLSTLERALPAGLQPEIDIDFVLHRDTAGQLGPGAHWAATARLGQQVSLLAPLRGSGLWSSWAPGAYREILLLADETATPAALSILRTLPEQARGTLVCEVPASGDDLSELEEVQQALTRLPGITLSFLPRGPEDQHGQRLVQHLRHLLNLPQKEPYRYTPTAAPDELVWGLAGEQTETYVFIAGESSVIKTLRRICVNEAGIDKRSISFMGYWKYGRAEG